MTDEADLTIGGLRVWVRGREFPDALDFWDGNWLRIRAVAEAVGARVEAQGPALRNTELEAFAEQLSELDRTLQGHASLQCLEPTLHVDLECGATGQVTAEVSLTPDHLCQSHQFTFDFDQTYLRPILASCRSILERYPVRDRQARA